MYKQMVSQHESQEQDTTNPYAIGGGYNDTKVRQALNMIDVYIRRSLFGFEIQYPMPLPKDAVIYQRIESLDRLREEMKLLFDNTEFGIKVQWKKEYRELNKEMNNLDKYFMLAFSNTRNELNETKSMRINEKPFNTLLNQIKSIKKRMMKPLNESGFIFYKSEEQNFENLTKRLSTKG